MVVQEYVVQLITDSYADQTRANNKTNLYNINTLTKEILCLINLTHTYYSQDHKAGAIMHGQKTVDLSPRQLAI